MEVEIFVKEECKNNKKQVALLEQRGHDLKVKSIFKEEWTKEKLKLFFEGLPFEKWFNPYAPRIKNGELKIEMLNPENILEEMIHDNYLIRRPLIRSGENYACGFDSSLAVKLMEGSEATSLLGCHQTGKVCE